MKKFLTLIKPAYLNIIVSLNVNIFSIYVLPVFKMLDSTDFQFKMY